MQRNLKNIVNSFILGGAVTLGCAYFGNMLGYIGAQDRLSQYGSIEKAKEAHKFEDNKISDALHYVFFGMGENFAYEEFEKARE